MVNYTNSFNDNAKNMLIMSDNCLEVSDFFNNNYWIEDDIPYNYNRDIEDNNDMNEKEIKEDV